MSDAPPPSGSFTPKVSVAMITYNHERFIAQAIESVLMQQADFPIELVIGEDCSTDGTRKLVEQYARLHPEVIRPLLHPKNLGFMRNYMSVYEACRGEFVACLEGDDYWMDPLKLQKQVDILRQNPEVSFCFHRVRVTHEIDTKLDYTTGDDRDRFYHIDEMVRGFIAPTCSTLIRRSMLPALPEGFENLTCGDIPSQLLLASRGPAYFSGEVMGTYRRHSGGVSFGGRRETLAGVKNLKQLLLFFNHHTQGRYLRMIRCRLGSLYLALAVTLSRESQHRGALSASLRSLAWLIAGRDLPGLGQWVWCLLIPDSAKPAYFRLCSHKNRLTKVLAK